MSFKTNAGSYNSGLDELLEKEKLPVVLSGDATLDELLRGGFRRDFTYLVYGDRKITSKILRFGESLINDDLSYFEELCDMLIEKNLDMKFGTHFRANITPSLTGKAKLAGFEDAWVGFEAFSDTELKEMNKGTTFHQFKF